jgi:acyl dehydratase
MSQTVSATTTPVPSGTVTSTTVMRSTANSSATLSYGTIPMTDRVRFSAPHRPSSFSASSASSATRERGSVGVQTAVGRR